MMKRLMIGCASAWLALATPASADNADYNAFLETAKMERQAASDPAAKLFTWIDKDMPDFWDETTWDFNGTSRIPGEGDIACGYFVTTLLEDLGFDINHVRLAQQASSVMIRKLTTDIKTTTDFEKMIEYIQAQPTNSVFIVGLDFHTGFITSSEDGIYFVHSNYIGREGVVKELAEDSAALNASGFFMIGNLTTNTPLIKGWADQ